MRSGGGPSRSPGSRAPGARRTLTTSRHRAKKGGGAGGRRAPRRVARGAGDGGATDAYQVAAPDIEGRGVERAMRLALEDADLSAGAVGHVNAHATSTPTGDGPETKAVSRFVPHAAVSATKSMTGHSFGAVGATEGIMCALALKHKILPPTINLEKVADDCESLDYVTEAREVPRLGVALSNSMGRSEERRV